MVGILSIRRKTQNNQSINQSRNPTNLFCFIAVSEEEFASNEIWFLIQVKYRTVKTTYNVIERDCKDLIQLEKNMILVHILTNVYYIY